MPAEEPDRSRSHSGRFHSTLWGNVVAARDPADPLAGAALAELCRTYFGPTTPKRARRPFDASVDHTEARKSILRLSLGFDFLLFGYQRGPRCD
jgi:hypothetical protein